jgi:hypothetical protein
LSADATICHRYKTRLPKVLAKGRAVTAKVLFEGRRACGVAYYHGDKLKQARARR